MHDNNENRAYGLHIISMWLAFILISGLITYYVISMRNTLREQQKTLANLSTSAGASPLENRRATEVGLYLQNVLDQIYVVHPQFNIETNWTQQSDKCIILADRSLTQALTNIIDNAIETSPDKVSWIAMWDDKVLTMLICDRGPGITKDLAEQIGNNPISNKENGMGLGLFLAHAMINRVEGKVGLSNRTGGGSCTEITLPLIQA